MQLDLGFEEREKPEPTPRVLSVSELTKVIRGALERQVGEVWVRGEISNYRRQSSGHHYFTLKDDGSQLPCVLFAGTARLLRGLRLADGMQVQIFGELTVYEARGQYQLVAQLVQEEGRGALQARFEALKTRLAAEGVFDAARKKSLPKFPARIGVVTSPTGAAIRDFLKVLHRRMPSIKIIIHPVRVQGRGAAAEIAAAVTDFSTFAPPVDVIVVTRGGGSLEDLWEFNEEAVARAIAVSQVPVVSAVGHEIDFTLADFAADLRAPTPSAAAEMIVPDAEELLRHIRQQGGRMFRECAGAVRLLRARLIAHERSALFREPRRLLRERRQQLDGLGDAMDRALAAGVRERRGCFVQLDAAGRMAAVLRRVTQQRRHRRDALVSLLRALSPDATLARGYSITFDARGGIVRSAREVGSGEVLRTRFADGEVESVVKSADSGN